MSGVIGQSSAGAFTGGEASASCEDMEHPIGCSCGWRVHERDDLMDDGWDWLREHSERQGDLIAMYRAET